MTFKSGFVAILGRPNVGKSTFLNHVMGQKIAIMSDKAQTTRNKIMGIYTTDKEQIVFIDTPGIHKPKTALVVILAGFVFQVSRIEWLFLLLSIFLVVAFEIINSAIENVVDLASHYHFSMLAKNAKDMAAGAILVVSLFATLTGALIFLPRIWDLLF